MPRIAVVGNCQALGVAEILKYFLPSAFIKQSISWEISNWVDSYEDFAADLSTFDFVFVQNVNFGNFTDANLERLQRDVPHVVEFPVIVFPAFHPDLVYISNKSGNGSEFILSPIGPYNSAIALFSYKRNYSLVETLKLYNKNVYERLGYFDFWTLSRDTLLSDAKKVGFDLTENLARWTREGCFMHSINHAKLNVLADIAALLLEKVGLRAHEQNWKDYVTDPAQLDAVWPVYPEVAERFSQSGSYIFKRPDYVSKGQKQFYTLDSFVSGSFDSFRYFPQNKISCDRVDQWLDDKAIVSFLDQTVTRKL